MALLPPTEVEEIECVCDVAEIAFVEEELKEVGKPKVIVPESVKVVKFIPLPAAIEVTVPVFGVNPNAPVTSREVKPPQTATPLAAPYLRKSDVAPNDGMCLFPAVVK